MSINQLRIEFAVDPITLQALHPLIQWIADLVIYLLTSLHVFQHNSSVPGIELVRDAGIITKLRELLIIIRLWGCICPTCLPSFVPVIERFDALQQLFKLVTKIWLTIKDNPTSEFEEALVDECSLLPSQMLILFCDRALFGDVRVYQSSVFLQSHPVQFVFNEPPSYISRLQTFIVPDGRTQAQLKRDVVRQISLGEETEDPVRQCTRCNSMSLCSLNKTGSNPMKNDWEKRWFVTCPCGGQWKLLTK